MGKQGKWQWSVLGRARRSLLGRRARTERLEFRLVGDCNGREPVAGETNKRFADVVGAGALRLEYRAELRNRGEEDATVRAWRWWVASTWDRSYHYLPLESRIELARVGEERKGLPWKKARKARPSPCRRAASPP